MNRNFSKTVIKKEIAVKSLYTIHYQSLVKNYTSKEESHDFWEINYIDKGTMSVVINGKSEELKQGEIIFIAPNLPHYVKTGENEPNVFIISFECKSPAMRLFPDKKSAVNKADRFLLQEIMTEAENTFVIPEFDPDLNALAFKKDGYTGGLQSVSSFLELFLIRFMRRNKTSPDADRFILSANADLKDRILAFLSEKIYSTFSLKELCDDLHYKKSWLCSYFYKKTGMHIYNTYLKMKMNEAKKLIRQNFSFTEIADKLCFDNAFYFSASFKKRVGMTPGEYRASIK
ncbi:MAG: helix-turn-helix domain-containing protein [Clostridia bacterium]|nr:helix-turn-helix domain-containing protein [Clostridia bacterium]